MNINNLVENLTKEEFNMRPATKEERQAVADYIDSISVDTGLNLWDLQEQVKIYDAYKNRGFDEGIKKTVDILVDYIDCQLCPLRKECTGGFYCKQELTKFVKNKI